MVRCLFARFTVLFYRYIFFISELKVAAGDRRVLDELLDDGGIWVRLS